MKTKEIKKKIGSVQNTKKITSAMELVASSKMKKTQDAMKKGKPYSQKIIEVLIEGTSVKKGILDPIGTDLLPGPELYFNLMKNLSISLKSCLN